MARPLKYDDQFRNIISSNLYSNFLFCIKLKVPSTTFFGRSNLQKGLRVLGIIDIVFFFLFFIIHKWYLHIAFIQKVLYYSTGLFGLIALDASKNLKKINSIIYYYWRIAILIILPLYELSDYLYLQKCYFLSHYCHLISFFGMTFAFCGLSLYLTKIAWTFAIQIQNGNELLILHGNYLKQMFDDENMKIEQKNIYIPPQILIISESKFDKDSKRFNNEANNTNAQINQFIFKMSNDNGKDYKNVNPFRNALNTIGMGTN